MADITRKAIQFVVKSDPKLVSIERKKQLLKAKIKAKQLAKLEQDLHESLHPAVEKVVHDKKILLWKTLLAGRSGPEFPGGSIHVSSRGLFCLWP